jgi:hypothetical protein
VSARQKALLWTGVIFGCGVLVFVKVRIESGAELDLAHAARLKPDIDAASLHYRRAIRWYTPFSSSVATAVRELEELASMKAKDGDSARALALYRDLRGALYAIRHLREPYREVRDRTEERIADLMAAEPPAAEIDRGKSAALRRSEYLAMYRNVPTPSVAWSVALLAGFFGWVAAGATFFWRGFTREGLLVARPALFWGGLVVVFFALWVVGLTQA